MTFENFRKKRGRKSKRPPEEVLRKYYDKYDISRIAKKYGVSKSTVYSWAQYYRNQHKQEASTEELTT